MSQKVFKPIGKFGRVIAPSKQTPQSLKRRRDKMKPSFMLLYTSPERVQRRYCGYLAPVIRRSRGKKVQIENGR